MIEGLIGKKIGMTHLFAGEARVIPVTVLEVGPCVVTQVRTESRDGYEAVQIGYGAAKQLSKPAAGHLAASGARVRTLREFEADDVSAYRVGQELRVSQFQADDLVDVVSTTKGRGFQGAMRRHGFGGGQKTHGQGDRGRAVGSIGAGTYPGRVLKGKKMPGHMGNKRKTIRKLKVVSVDTQRNLLFVRGAVPGSRNTTVMVRYAHGVPVAERTIPEEPVVEIEETVAEVEGTVTEAAEAAQEGQAADAPQDEPETSQEALAAEAEEPAAEAEAASSDETSQDAPAAEAEEPAAEAEAASSDEASQDAPAAEAEEPAAEAEAASSDEASQDAPAAEVEEPAADEPAAAEEPEASSDEPAAEAEAEGDASPAEESGEGEAEQADGEEERS